jgi:hypothetical protein
LRRKAILSAGLILEKNNWQEKQHAREEAFKARRKANLTRTGLGFLTNIVTAISL